MTLNKTARSVRGYVVVAVAFIIQAVTFGSSASIGLYNSDFIETFNGSFTTVSLVGSLNLGVFLCSGPVASVLMCKWSHRQVTLFGALISSIGLTCMPFSPNLEFMYVFYGIITGLGFTFLYIPSIILCGLYFPKKQSLVTGTATAGAGVGSILYPFIVHSSIEQFGWRGSMFILASVNLQMLVLAALLKPLPTTVRSVITSEQPSTIPQNAGEEIQNGISMDRTEFSDDSVMASSLNRTNETFHVRSTMRRVLKMFCDSICTTNGLYFVIYCFNNICWNAALGIPTIFLPDYMKEKGLSKEDASLGLVLLGVGSCLGSLCSGALGSKKWCKRIILYIISNIVFAITLFLFLISSFQDYNGILTLVFIVGFSYGAIAGLLVVLTTDILGLKLTGIGYGFILVAGGIGQMVGPPIAGVFVDSVGGLNIAMTVSGIFAAVGSVLMCPIPICQKIQELKDS